MVRLLTISMVAIAVAGAQSSGQPLAFEVATVKPTPMEASRNSMGFNGCSGGPGSSDPARYTCRGLTLKTLLEIAYRMVPQQISGPAWIDSERYDIFAKPPANATREQMAPMLRSLLEERFELKSRREAKTLPIYAMLAPHGSAKLKRSLAEGEEEDRAAATARARAAGQRARSWGPGVGAMFIMQPRMSMADLADTLSSRMDRPVRDMTGLDGTFAINLQFALNPGPAISDDAPHAPTAMEALQEELGLRLEAQKGEIEVLTVIEARKKPRESE